MATQPNISAQPSAQTLAARRFGYAQLTAENQQVADNVAAFMLLVQSIDKLPPERQQTALDMLGRGDVSGLAKEVWTVAGSGMTGLAGLVTRMTGSAQAEMLGGTGAGRALNAIERMANGGSVPFMMLGLPADMLQSVRNRFQGEGIGVAGRLWGTTPLTNDAAREIGTAYASALQVRQEARGNTSFMQGLFSANFMTYIGAAISYATQYVGWAMNHVFGDKTATLRSLDSFVQEAMRPGDLPFVADSLKAAGTIAGVRMTDMLAQGLVRGGTFTDRQGQQFMAPPASDFTLDTTGRGQTPLPAPAAEQDPTRKTLGQIGEALSTPAGATGAVAAGAAVGYAGYHAAAPAARATVAVGGWSWNRMLDAGALTLKGAKDAVLGTTAGFLEGSATVGRILTWPLPNSARTIERATTALDKEALAAARAAVAGQNFGLLGRFSPAYREAVRDAADAFKAQRAGEESAQLAARVAQGADARGLMTRVGDFFRGNLQAVRADAKALEQLTVTASNGINEGVAALRAGRPAAAAGDVAMDAATRAARDAVAAAEAGREAARAQGLSRFSRGYAEAVEAGKAAFLDSRTAQAATEATTTTANTTARVAEVAADAAKVTKPSWLFRVFRVGGRLIPFAGAGAVGLELTLPNPAYAREYDGRALSPMAMLDEDLKRGRITQAQHDTLRAIQLGNIGAGALGPLGTMATESALMVNGRVNPAYERYLSKPILDTLGELFTLPRVERTPEQQQFDRVYDALGTAPAAAPVPSAPVAPAPVAAAAPEVPADIRALMELRAKREVLNDQAYGQGALTPGTTATGLPDWSRRDHARRELQRVEAEFENRYAAIQQNPTLAAQLKSLTDPAPTQQAAPSAPATHPRVSDVRLPDSITGGVAADEGDANRRPNAPFSMRSTTPPAMGAVLAN